MVEVILFLIFLGVCVVIDALERDEDEALEPHDLAQPSIERLQADAERALEELRALDYHEREES